jgi:hypothetical protein
MFLIIVTFLLCLSSRDKFWKYRDVDRSFYLCRVQMQASGNELQTTTMLLWAHSCCGPRAACVPTIQTTVLDQAACFFCTKENCLLQVLRCDIIATGRPSTHPVVQVQVQLSFLIISLSLARSPRRFLAPLSARSAMPLGRTRA